MTTYTTLADTNLALDKPVTQSVGRAGMRDNLKSVCEGDSSAPAVVGLSPLVIKTASASASLDFTSGISASYDLYELEICNLITASTGVTLALRVSTDGGTTWKTSGYIFNVNSNRTDAGGVAGNVFDSSVSGADTSKINLTKLDAMGGGFTSGVVRIFNPATTGAQKLFMWDMLHSTDSSAFVHVRGAGVYNGSSTAINGLRIVATSGNITSGTVYLRGRRKVVGI